MSNVSIYSVSIKRDGTLIKNYVPAKRDSDDKVGMVEAVSGTFLTSATAFDFIGGPEKAGNTPRIGLLCHNYRATEFQAQILLDQLQHLTVDSAFRAENAKYLRRKLKDIPGIGTQAPGRCATMQSYYVYGITVDPEFLRPGITREDVIKAVNAEGATEVFGGWGATTFQQALWNVAPEKYRVESAAVVDDIIRHRIILLGIQWLMTDRANLDRLVEAFAKVMKAYSR